MSGFTGSYIRVSTPVTTDGKNLKYVDGEPLFKESHWANTRVSKEALDAIISRLPDHLKPTYEVVGGELYKPTPKKNTQQRPLTPAQIELAKLKDQLAKAESEKAELQRQLEEDGEGKEKKKTISKTKEPETINR